MRAGVRRSWQKTQPPELLQVCELLGDMGPNTARGSAVEQQVRDLDEVLASALPRRLVSLSGLTAPSAPPRFEPGALAVGNPPPDWADFAPADPKGLARIFPRHLAR